MEKSMQLCYRGVRYDYSPQAVEFQEGEVIGYYRGRPLRAHLKRGGEMLAHLSSLLTYRGASYQH